MDKRQPGPPLAFGCNYLLGLANEGKNMSDTTARDCQHGQLARSCDRCADAAEIAGLRYELTRAIAQRDDEGDRLDWVMTRLILMDNVPTRAQLRQIANTSDAAEWRTRIDDARGERGQCVRRMSDGRICGLRAASCPDCGPAVHDVPQGA